jgi:hypothetical protein
LSGRRFPASGSTRGERPEGIMDGMGVARCIQKTVDGKSGMDAKVSGPLSVAKRCIQENKRLFDYTRKCGTMPPS